MANLTPRCGRFLRQVVYAYTPISRNRLTTLRYSWHSWRTISVRRLMLPSLSAAKPSRYKPTSSTTRCYRGSRSSTCAARRYVRRPPATSTRRPPPSCWRSLGPTRRVSTPKTHHEFDLPEHVGAHAFARRHAHLSRLVSPFLGGRMRTSARAQWQR